MADRRPTDPAVLRAALLWTLDGEGFQSEWMRLLLGRNWHARLRRALDRVGNVDAATRKKLDRLR